MSCGSWHLSDVELAHLSNALFLGMFAGSNTVGYISDRHGRRIGVLFGVDGIIILCFCVIFVVWVGGSQTLFLCFGSLCKYIIAFRDLLTKRLLSRRFNVALVLCSFFGALSSLAPSFPLLLAARLGVGTGVGGSPAAITLYTETLPTAGRSGLLKLTSEAPIAGPI